MADANALTRFDLGAQPRDRPVAPVGHRFLQQGRDHAQGRFALHRGWTGRHAGLQRRDAPVHEIAAPETDRVFTHAECLGYPWAGPAGQRQQHGAGTVRLAAIARAGQNPQLASLFFGCPEWRFSRHACTSESARQRISPPSVGQPREFCLALPIVEEAAEFLPRPSFYQTEIAPVALVDRSWHSPANLPAYRKEPFGRGAALPARTGSDPYEAP